ncbi:F-box family protein [Striga asiatica]|uniref:F-box family protein n=1 Tax=Striga asiatica TaxID=4170 RepID=A0A5A7R0H8_STRAF|nr:F-box family protein [Striga asiatica]
MHWRPDPVEAGVQVWRDTLTRSEFPTLPELPWLILPDPEPISTYLSLSCPYENRIYFPDLPCSLLSGGRRWSCRGSGAGWFLLACWDPPEMVLWDPLSGATLSLPSPSTLPLLDHDTRLAQVAPVGPVVAVFFSLTGFRDRLALCSPDDQCWTVLSGPTDEHYADILFQNEKLRAVCRPPSAYMCPETHTCAQRREDLRFVG